jgi:hypothetical protein
MALPGEINITCLGCQLSAGQSGSAGIKCVLKKNKNPSVILHSACSFMCFWAGLHSEEAREAINYIVDLLTKVAVKILRRAKDTRRVPTLMGVIVAMQMLMDRVPEAWRCCRL